MANEIRYPFGTGETIDAYVFRKSDGKVWYPTGATFETWGTDSRAANDYKAVTLTEAASGAQWYAGDFPTAITTAAYYDVQLRLRAGSSPANSDTVIGMSMIDWTGTEEAAAAETTPNDATDLANYALAKIGGSLGDADSWELASINGSTKEAELMLLLYNRVRREVLLRMRPKCARKYAELTTANTSVERADWEYAFDLPSDYLGHARQIWEDYHRTSRTRPEYRLEVDHEIVQGALLTNNYTNTDDDGAYIEYTFNQTDVGEFTDNVYEAIATKLAAEASPGILRDGGQRRAMLLDEYENVVLGRAMTIEHNQDGDDDEYGQYTALTCRTT